MTELDEVRQLLAQATFPGVIEVLRTHEKSLEDKIKVEEVRDHEEVNDVQEVVEEPSPKKSKPSVDLKQDVRVAAPLPSTNKTVYIPITSFAWDQDGYDSPIVTVYVDLEKVGSVKDNVKCDFTSSSFDLQVLDLNEKNYRLVKDNLDKDIVPEKSKFIVKKNKIVIKLQKVKGQYSYESW